MVENMEVIYKSILGLFVVVIGWFTKSTVEGIRTDMASVKKDLSEHKLHVSDHYAKEATMQSSLARIHDRIDLASEDINHKIDIISHDVKTILTNKK